MEEENSINIIEEGLMIEKHEINEIKQKIFWIRGKQVMLDSDVAARYKYTTKNINKAMKRNIERFPEDFCFQLTEEEVLNLRFQIGTSSLEKENYGGRRYLPYAYTEQGVAMLSGMLKTEIAVQVSINIMRAFVEMRKFLFSNQLMIERINSIEINQLEYKRVTDEKIAEYDSNFQKLFEEFEKEDEQKFNKEYPILKIAKTDKFHDRFIIIDNKELYHCGASLKDLGKKCFGINRIEDVKYIESLLRAANI